MFTNYFWRKWRFLVIKCVFWGSKKLIILSLLSVCCPHGAVVRMYVLCVLEILKIGSQPLLFFRKFGGERTISHVGCIFLPAHMSKEAWLVGGKGGGGGFSLIYIAWFLIALLFKRYSNILALLKSTQKVCRIVPFSRLFSNEVVLRSSKSCLSDLYLRGVMYFTRVTISVSLVHFAPSESSEILVLPLRSDRAGGLSLRLWR